MSPSESLGAISQNYWVQKTYSVANFISLIYTFGSIIFGLLGYHEGWFNMPYFRSFSFEQIYICILFLGIVLNTIISFFYKRQLENYKEDAEAKLTEEKVASARNIAAVYESSRKQIQKIHESWQTTFNTKVTTLETTNRVNQTRNGKELAKANEEINQWKEKAEGEGKRADKAESENKKLKERSELTSVVGDLRQPINEFIQDRLIANELNRELERVKNELARVEDQKNNFKRAAYKLRNENNILEDIIRDSEKNIKDESKLSKRNIYVNAGEGIKSNSKINASAVAHDQYENLSGKELLKECEKNENLTKKD